MPWARAASMSFLTVGTVATQRGRAPQLPFMKSSTSSAVVLGSTVTGLSAGTGGAFTLAQSATMSPAHAGSAAKAAAANSTANCFFGYVMVVLPVHDER